MSSLSLSLCLYIIFISKLRNQLNSYKWRGFPLLVPRLSSPTHRHFRKSSETLDEENNITSLLSFQVCKQKLDTANYISLSQIPLPYQITMLGNFHYSPGMCPVNKLLPNYLTWPTLTDKHVILLGKKRKEREKKEWEQLMILSDI